MKDKRIELYVCTYGIENTEKGIVKLFYDKEKMHCQKRCMWKSMEKLTWQ